MATAENFPIPLIVHFPKIYQKRRPQMELTIGEAQPFGW
jgi:hypothetical protein